MASRGISSTLWFVRSPSRNSERRRARSLLHLRAREATMLLVSLSPIVVYESPHPYFWPTGAKYNTRLRSSEPFAAPDRR